jgi:predicted DNA binding CopG/RHH family protein
MTDIERRMRPKEPIPEFKSRQEEAEFWDTHDLGEYWAEFQPVKVRFAKNLSEGITVRFDPETLNRLRAEAKKKGMGPTTLARMWILERLQGAGS